MRKEFIFMRLPSIISDMGSKNSYLIWVLLGVLFLSLIVSINIAMRRYQFENHSNHIEMAVSYHEMEQLSTLGGVDTLDLLKQLHDEAKITSVAIEEDTLEDFVERGKVTVLKGSEIINMYRVGHVNRFLLTHLYKQIKVKPNRFYIIIEEKEDYERIRDFLSVEFGNSNVSHIGRLNILEVTDSRDDLMQLGMGISISRLNSFKKLGLTPIIRLKNSNRLNKYIIKKKFLSFINDIPQATLIFEGDTVLGYPNHLTIVEEKIRDNQLRLGFVEFTKRLGINELASKLPESVIRVHTITEEEMAVISRKQAVQRYIRAARERGIKILFVRPFFQGYHEESMVAFNIKFMTMIGQGLVRHHKQIASLDTEKRISYKSATTWEILILSLGVLTIILFLTNFFFKWTFWNFLGVNILFISLFYSSVFLHGLSEWVQIMALITAIIFPCFAMVSQFPSETMMLSSSKRAYYALIYLLKVLGITMIGSFLIIGFLSEITFIEGVSRFVGVKLSFIIPLILITIFYFFKPHRLPSILYILKRIAHTPVNTSSIIAIGFAITFITLLLLRSGNYIPMPQLLYEEKFRGFLENILFVRPRTKEFFIGYPFLFFSYWAVDHYISRRWIWLFNGIGLVALISVINSFCHIHTPINISIYRTCIGVIMGGMVGIFYIIIFQFIYGIYRRLLK